MRLHQWPRTFRYIKTTLVGSTPQFTSPMTTVVCYRVIIVPMIRVKVHKRRIERSLRSSGTFRLLWRTWYQVLGVPVWSTNDTTIEYSVNYSILYRFDHKKPFFLKILRRTMIFVVVIHRMEPWVVKRPKSTTKEDMFVLHHWLYNERVVFFLSVIQLYDTNDAVPTDAQQHQFQGIEATGS